MSIIKSQAGLNRYKISVKEWVEKTNAIGLKATAGRYGGTYAHKDIVFEFGMWISPEFKIYLIKEFQRLKEDEQKRISLEWSLQRTTDGPTRKFSYYQILLDGQLVTELPKVVRLGS